MKLILHHFAYNLKPDTLEFAIELFKQLGCIISYRKKGARWCIVEQKQKQKQKPIGIQLIETKDKAISTKIKVSTHIAFLSNSPEDDIKKIKKWVESKNKKFVYGTWSNKEHWFDVPEVFTNFVIEIMHTSITL